MTPLEKYELLKARLASLEGQVRGALAEWHEAHRLAQEAQRGLIPEGGKYDPATRAFIPQDQRDDLRAARAEYYAKLKREADAIGERRDVAAKQRADLNEIVVRCEATLRARGMLEKQRPILPMPAYREPRRHGPVHDEPNASRI